MSNRGKSQRYVPCVLTRYPTEYKGLRGTQSGGERLLFPFGQVADK